MGMFADKLVEKARKEFTDHQNLLENQSPLRERIGVYWDLVGRPDLDGGDDVAWSAAFISYMVKLAGAGTQFRYSAQHSVYFYRTINDRLISRPRPFWGYRPSEVTIAPGDILGMNRGDAPAISYDWAATHADYSSHADIVVNVTAAGAIQTIGGNVGKRPGQVGEKSFSVSGGKLLNDANANQEAFVVIRTFLP